MKHILCVRFRQWSIDLVKRKRRPDKPLALILSTASRQTVAFACERARAGGVAAGMTLAEARAMCAGLIACEHRPEVDRRSLHAMARKLIQFSPIVAVEAPDALFLDVTGSERLFGGFERLIDAVSQTLTQLHFTFGSAVAPTPGAAWALATYHHQIIVTMEALPLAVASLPIAVLRLSDEIVGALSTLGIEIVDQLQRLPRRSLPARFGSIVLTRLDQMFGLANEPLIAVRRPRQIRALLESETSVQSLEMVWEVLKRLVMTVTSELTQLQQGAKRLSLQFVSRDEGAMQKDIQLSKPTRDVSLILNLLRCASEAIRSDTGFTAFSLSVVESERLTGEQLYFVPDETAGNAQAVGHLIERLRVRLGAGVVLTPLLAESHLPERAVCLLEAGEPTQGRKPIDPPRLKARPVHLLPEPVEIQCVVAPSATREGTLLAFIYNGESYTIVHASGPEKIAGMWWEGRNKTREYFDAEEKSGRRFWLFRVSENRRWFLHGIFDC